MSRQWPRLHPRHRANRDIATPMSKRPLKPARRRDSRPRRGWQASPFHGVLRRRAKLESNRADHRSRRSRRGRTGHPLRRHQSEQPQRSRGSTRMSIAVARPRPKTMRQVLEDPSGGGSHVLLQGDSQPVFGCSCMRGAYWLMWGLRVSIAKVVRCGARRPVRRRCASASSKIAARVVEMTATMIRVHLPTSCPAQDILPLRSGDTSYRALVT